MEGWRGHIWNFVMMETLTMMMDVVVFAGSNQDGIVPTWIMRSHFVQKSFHPATAVTDLFSIQNNVMTRMFLQGMAAVILAEQNMDGIAQDLLQPASDSQAAAMANVKTTKNAMMDSKTPMMGAALHAKSNKDMCVMKILTGYPIAVLKEIVEMDFLTP